MIEQNLDRARIAPESRSHDRGHPFSVDDIGFAKSVAQEVASRGITVNVVAPGPVETDMTAALGDKRIAELVAAAAAEVLGPDAVGPALPSLGGDDFAFLLQRIPGIAADRVQSVGYGLTRPIADNRTAEGRATNRRMTAEISETVTRTQ